MSFVLVEKTDRIAWVTLNRPEKLNALNNELLKELEQVFAALEQDADIFLTSYDTIPWLLDVQKTTLPSGKIRVKANRGRMAKLGFDLMKYLMKVYTVTVSGIVPVLNIASLLSLIL